MKPVSNAVQRGAEPLAHTGQPGDDLGEAVQCPAAAQLAGVVGDRFEPQDARAFGVALECQQPEVDFEHCQVPRRCLEHDPDPGRGGCAVLAGTAAGPEQGPQGRDVQPGPGPVQHGVEHPVHVTAVGKQQVTGVFGLVDRVGVAEAGPPLIGQVQAEDQAGGVDPPVDDLAQPPCSRILRQGVCDLSQASRIRGSSKTVALLGEADALGLCGHRDVLVAVQDHLRGERRMPGHLDHQVPPLGVHDVEAVVIDVRALAGQAAEHRAVRGPAHIPHHRRGPGDQDQEHTRAHRMGAQVLLRDQVLAFPRRAVDHRDGVIGGPGPDPPREPARQPHQVSVVQHRIGLGVTAPDQAPPPGPESARRAPHRVVGIQHDPVHAVIPASQQIPVPLSEVIGHAPTVEPTRASGQDISHTAPQGPLLPGGVPDAA